MEHKIFTMPFSRIYLLYVQKVERKNRTKEEVDEIIFWLTSYTKENLDFIIKNNISVKEFFDNAPRINEKTEFIKGVICGIRV